MRKASTPPSLPHSQPILLFHLKTSKICFEKNHKMSSLSTIICQIPGTTGGHGTMLIYGLLWIIPSGALLPFFLVPHPLQAASSRETLNRHMPCRVGYAQLQESGAMWKHLTESYASSLPSKLSWSTVRGDMPVLRHKPRGLVHMYKETAPVRISWNFDGFPT